MTHQRSHVGSRGSEKESLSSYNAVTLEQFWKRLSEKESVDELKTWKHVGTNKIRIETRKVANNSMFGGRW